MWNLHILKICRRTIFVAYIIDLSSYRYGVQIHNVGDTKHAWRLRTHWKGRNYIQRRNQWIYVDCHIILSYHWNAAANYCVVLVDDIFLLLDLNQLRENAIENASIYKIIDDNHMMLDKVDGYIKPHLKTFLKVVLYHSDLPYEYDKHFFENNTSFQVIKNFATELNITSSGDFISKVVVGWLTPEYRHESDLND